MGFWSKIFGSGKAGSNRKQPEDYYHTEITEEYIKVTHPKRKDEQINWDEI